MAINSICSVPPGPHLVIVHTEVVLSNRRRAPHSHLQTPSKRSVCVRATAPQRSAQRSAKLPLDAAQAEKYAAISRAFEARLSNLYTQAPNDEQLPTIDTEAWDDEELLKEGRELRNAEDAPQTLRNEVLWVCCPV